MTSKNTNFICCANIRTKNSGVSNNNLMHTCSICKRAYSQPLQEIKKHLIYLDQNFLSNAYKAKLDPFIKRSNRLEELANKQQLVCPLSDSHDKETYFFKEDKGLWEFMYKFSHGKRFHIQNKIKEQQIINAYNSFLNKGQSKTTPFFLDALPSDIHKWDEWPKSEVRWRTTDFIGPVSLIYSKIRFPELFFQALPQWKKSKTSLIEDYQFEIKEHARLLLNPLSISTDVEKTSEIYSTLYTLLEIDNATENMGKKLENLRSFGSSPNKGAF